ncbi:uncharacterized protein Pyn_23471 [Prunus yedoensis var. nudiflora]|uniref:Homer protein n=1 Tax=Prunus yedoensis var. nudiflora TaxID=2094558 RepID=A0A314ZJR8_PRUYE|nr:uncharacterized protein Pyn_23471 [Prunus yedoensis var. nudiflora]
MVELQSCAPLVNASALCVIEDGMRGESVNVIAEISAELERERQKNAELMERILILEAQIQERDKEPPRTDGQGSCSNAMERSFKKFKRQKIELTSKGTEDRNIIPSEMASQKKHDKQCLALQDPILEHRLVNWMSMEETQFLHLEKVKDGDSADSDDTDDTDDDFREEDCINNDHKEGEADDVSRIFSVLKYEVVDKGSDVPCTKDFSCVGEPVFSNVNQETNELPDTGPVCNEMELTNQNKKETNDFGSYNVPPNILTLQKEFLHTVSASISQQKKPPKVAFCPKEVKRIIDSESLLQKNAQSHTIRKIIVFASLGIRHGCEDIYELDFNHFSILRKGEPYMSPKDPGEHVLYENPGVRRKVLYPNQQNPTLCPVQILEEEKAMRPLDPSCPSWLFLCIKYGGRTRNLPQNEYVRQRMGRNKLKSFGPLMCRMAMLVHIRSGSFFFKALGIALLFMAGFPDDLVQRETKYRNLDLLQKYYRTDDDAEGEELFLPHPMPCDTASPGSQKLYGKTCSTKTKGKKQTHSNSKPHYMQRSSFPQTTLSASAPSAQFGLVGHTSIQTHTMATFQSMPSQSQTPLDAPPISNTLIPNAGAKPHIIFFPHNQQTLLCLWYFGLPRNIFSPGPYQSSYGYPSFPSTGNYFVHPRPYYGHPSFSPLIPKMVEAVGKNVVASEEADSDYDCSSSSTEPKKN